MRTLKCLFLSGLSLLAVNAWAVPCPPPSASDPSSDTCLDGSINVGRANLFTALSSGAMNLKDNTVTGPSLIQGNVGIGGIGSGNFSMSDGKLFGDIYIRYGGKVTFSGPSQHYNAAGDPYNIKNGEGVYYGNSSHTSDVDMKLQGALDDAYNLSSAASMELSSMQGSLPGQYSVTGGYNFNGSTVNTNKSFSITDNGASQKIVLNLKDLVMTGGTFTLNGTATTTYIVNVRSNFSLTGSAKIVLSGGLQASHVLFNVVNSGSQVSLTQGSSLTGILFAAQRKVDLSGGKVFGKVIGAQINVTSGGQIVSQ